jgi:hypothetical protein
MSEPGYWIVVVSAAHRLGRRMARRDRLPLAQAYVGYQAEVGRDSKAFWGLGGIGAARGALFGLIGRRGSLVMHAVEHL